MVAAATDDGLEREVSSFLRKVLKKVPARIEADTSFSYDLGLSSFDALQLVCDVEDEFGCSIPDERVRDLQTVGDLVTFVRASRR